MSDHQHSYYRSLVAGCGRHSWATPARVYHGDTSGEIQGAGEERCWDDAVRWSNDTHKFAQSISRYLTPQRSTLIQWGPQWSQWSMCQPKVLACGSNWPWSRGRRPAETSCFEGWVLPYYLILSYWGQSRVCLTYCIWCELVPFVCLQQVEEY